MGVWVGGSVHCAIVVVWTVPAWINHPSYSFNLCHDHFTCPNTCPIISPVLFYAQLYFCTDILPDSVSFSAIFTTFASASIMTHGPEQWLQSPFSASVLTQYSHRPIGRSDDSANSAQSAYYRATGEQHSQSERKLIEIVLHANCIWNIFSATGAIIHLS